MPIPALRLPALRRTLTFALAAALATPAGALIVPLPGWVPVGGDANYWTDATGQCLLREERHDQSFPAFDTPDKARAFALKLQGTLERRVDAVVTQPVDRAGTWGVLAAYDYVQGPQTYRVSQLYLSDEGRLRTVTGSSAVGGAAGTAAASCVNEMRDFIRYLAN